MRFEYQPEFQPGYQLEGRARRADTQPDTRVDTPLSVPLEVGLIFNIHDSCSIFTGASLWGLGRITLLYVVSNSSVIRLWLSHTPYCCSVKL